MAKQTLGLKLEPTDRGLVGGHDADTYLREGDYIGRGKESE